MNERETAQTHGTERSSGSNVQGFLQRSCACGTHKLGGEQCADCSKKQSVQTKLHVNEPGDVYEQQADRIADQVLAASPPARVNVAVPRVQRFTGQTTAGLNDAPASVDHVLANPGRPLNPVLRQDMSQRFGYDFSRVRVHSDTAAAESARELKARAYTVGTRIVFGSGQFVPSTHEGRRLIAHELTHVMQQDGLAAQHSRSEITPVQRTTHHSDSGGPGHPLPRQPPCPLSISGPKEVDHLCGKYVPSDVPTCGTFPAPNVELKASGTVADDKLTWDIVEGGARASIVGSKEGNSVKVKGDAASVTKEDVVARVSNGKCAARHPITVRQPKSLTAAQSPSSGPSFIQSLITYTLQDQFGDAMGADICLDETITICARSHPVTPTFRDAPTDALGQAIDQLRVGVASGSLPAAFCIKLNQVITAGGCGPVAHNTILYQPSGITLTPGGSCAVGDACP